METLQLLVLPESEQRRFWEKHIACDYWHGLYLQRATERSKNWCFKRWQKQIKVNQTQGGI